MKKQYTTPQMEVVEIQTAQMLCASRVTGLGGNSDLGLGGGSNSGGRSREEDDWDDEW